MITGLKPYPAMKASGVPWLGEVPEHWEVLPPKRVLRSRSSGAAPIKNTASAEPRADYVPAFSASGQDVWLPEPMFHGPGLVLSAVGARCGKTFRANGTWAIVANTHVLLVKEGHDRDFWWYVTNDEDWWERAGAAQPFVQVSKTLDRPWAVPPTTEQAAIVRFLDHADRRIRRYIRAKQKLIKLLEEQKQAIIHRAVTGGLDPNVRLKPSGVEWLGDVPEHWEELPLKRVSRLDNSGNYGVEPEQAEEALPVATTAQIDRDGRFDVARMPRRGFSRADVERYGCHLGDILVVKSSGSIFNVISGKAGIVRSDTPHFVFSNFLMRIVADPAEMEPEYLFLLLSGYLTRERVKRMVAGTTYPNLRVGEYVSALVPVPPIPEQRSIISSVSMMTAAVDHAVRSAQTEIDLVREYRTRLIADVVTGKLDVRAAAPSLPEEPGDLEQEDEFDDTLADASEVETHEDDPETDGDQR